ncbi:MAG: DNA alkylation repair protein [Saprospiraceae bacterium]
MQTDLFTKFQKEFQLNGSPERAKSMSAYMRNQFDYFGISSPKRKELQKKLFPSKLAFTSSDIEEFVLQCWDQDQREWKYLAMDFSRKYLKKGQLELLDLFERLITDQSWWDTVDCITPNIIAKILKPYPQKLKEKQLSWIESDNIWLQRSAIIIQLMFKEDTDFTLLKDLILRRAGSKEFFIQKASGWSLRQYSKTNPGAVVDFINSNTLAPLTKREGLRLMLPKK